MEVNNISEEYEPTVDDLLIELEEIADELSELEDIADELSELEEGDNNE